MNDLRNGILDIEGFLLGPQTRLEDFEEFIGVKATVSKRNPTTSFLDLQERTIFNNGILFKFDSTFKNGYLHSIELRPQFPDIAAKYDLTERSDDWLPYFKELRKILEKWLSDQLDEPTRKNDRFTTYDFGNVMVCTYSFEGCDKDYFVKGGQVDIDYLRR